MWLLVKNLQHYLSSYFVTTEGHLHHGAKNTVSTVLGHQRQACQNPTNEGQPDTHTAEINGLRCFIFKSTTYTMTAFPDLEIYNAMFQILDDIVGQGQYIFAVSSRNVESSMHLHALKAIQGNFTETKGRIPTPTCDNTPINQFNKRGVMIQMRAFMQAMEFT